MLSVRLRYETGHEKKLALLTKLQHVAMFNLELHLSSKKNLSQRKLPSTPFKRNVVCFIDDQMYYLTVCINDNKPSTIAKTNL